jgi:putative transposase
VRQFERVTPKHLRQLVESKQRWMDPLRPEEQSLGFKGWYASRALPHFDAPGAWQFVTFRLADSLPATQRHEQSKAYPDKTSTGVRSVRSVEAPDALMKGDGDVATPLPSSMDETTFQSHDEQLDLGFGECHLKDPRIAEIVQDSLWHFDGVRYRLLAWVIMPNHIHAVIEVWQTPLHKLLQGWKGFSARNANQVLDRTGTFWQSDYFDQYIRDADHYQRVVKYIEWNPVAVGLVRSPEDWTWSSAQFRGAPGAEVPCLTHPTATRTVLKS